MACRIGCNPIAGVFGHLRWILPTPADGRYCNRCWLPEGTVCRDTDGYFDRNKKFGTITAFVDAAWSACRESLLAVVPVPPLCDIILSCITIDRYRILDVVDAIDGAGGVYSAVISDVCSDDGDNEWYLLRYIGYSSFSDSFVRQDAIMPHTPPVDGFSTTPFAKRTIRIGDWPEIDWRWKTFHNCPFVPVDPDYNVDGVPIRPTAASRFYKKQETVIPA